MAPKNKARVSDDEEMEDQPQKSLYQVPLIHWRSVYHKKVEVNWCESKIKLILFDWIWIEVIYVFMWNFFSLRQ